MAQSPESASDSADSAYAKSWDALGALIAQGKSFSGRERNCAFLNLGAKEPSFACASGAVNLDQMDDSRAIIPADWDGDGDLDLWYSNRTAPRLRFLRNDMVNSSHWLALQLEGRTCNRDAIGARAELTLVAPDGSKRMLWRRLRAGDAFLSQTPKTLHFGFRSDEKIERLLIRWPAPGFDEVILPAVEADHFYKITQGAGAKQADRKAPPPPAAGAADLQEETNEIRAVLANRLPVPRLDYLDMQGHPQFLEGSQPQPVLVLFWGSWCPICRSEMNELTKHAAELKSLRVLALAVDTAKPEPDKSAIEDVRRALSGHDWPFDAGFATQATVRTLALLESRALYPERQLALPTAYLLTPDGKLAVIYHGPVQSSVIVKDAASASQSPADSEAAAFPFPGRSAKKFFPLNSAAQAQTLREAGYLDDARRELQRQLEAMPEKDAAARSAAWRRLADLEDEAGHLAESITAWERAAGLAPEDAATQLALAAVQWKAGRKQEAESLMGKTSSLVKDAAAFQNQLGKLWQAIGEHSRARTAFAASLAAAPDNAETIFNLAVASQFTGDTAGAIAGYEAALKKKPDLLDAGSNLAWLLATTKDEKLRQPARALALATQINKAATGQSPAVLDNLAAAQAASGDFQSAAATAAGAALLAKASGDELLAAEIRKHLAFYQKRLPWIE